MQDAMDGNLFFLSGFKPLDIDTYLGRCTGRLPEGAPDTIKYLLLEDGPDSVEHWIAYVEGESVGGVDIRMLKTSSFDEPQISVFVPWAASGIDIYLAYILMNVISEIHPNCSVMDTEGGEVAIDDSARDEEHMRRLNIIAMLLDLDEEFVRIPCLSGFWRMDLAMYRRTTGGDSIEGKISKVLYDITEDMWYRPDSPNLSQD